MWPQQEEKRKENMDLRKSQVEVPIEREFPKDHKEPNSWERMYYCVYCLVSFHKDLDLTETRKEMERQREAAAQVWSHWSLFFCIISKPLFV